MERDATDADFKRLLNILLLAREIQIRAVNAYSESNYPRIIQLLNSCADGVEAMRIKKSGDSCPPPLIRCGEICVDPNS